ncbi:MAG: hypothetical protein IKP47_01650 [Ruminococcus sp.]|nr:hypothetical protein [Ruminococcus sp.]
MNVLKGAAVGSIAVAISIFLGISQGISWMICVPVGAVFFVIVILVSLYDEHKNKSSFKEAEKLKAGDAFKNASEQRRYEQWYEKHEPKFPKKDMLTDLKSRYRSAAIAAEVLGAFLLLLALIPMHYEEQRDPEAAFVKYILIAGAVALLCLAASGMFGIKANRFYLRLTDRSDFHAIERSYMNSRIIGMTANAIVIGDEYLTLITPYGVIPITLGSIAVIRRADVLGNADYNGHTVSAQADMYFIKIYLRLDGGLTPGMRAVWRVRLNKFAMQQAYEILEHKGLPVEETIELN